MVLFAVGRIGRAAAPYGRSPPEFLGENEYTKEQQAQPEVQKKLRALGDFNPVTKK